MLKNILATIGLAAVVKAAYEHYCEYRDLKREKEARGGSPTYIGVSPDCIRATSGGDAGKQQKAPTDRSGGALLLPAA